MRGHELALEVGGEFCDRQAIRAAFEIVAIGLGFRGGLEIHDAAISARQLNAEVAERFHVFGNGGQGIEWSFVPHELGEEDCGSLNL